MMWELRCGCGHIAQGDSEAEAVAAWRRHRDTTAPRVDSRRPFAGGWETAHHYQLHVVVAARKFPAREDDL